MERLTAIIALAGLCIASTLSAAEEGKSVSSILVEDGRFTSLLAALDAADLVGTLESSEAVKGNLELEWSANRVGPYTLQRTMTLADPDSWENVTVTRDKSAKVPVDSAEAYFRVVR